MGLVRRNGRDYLFISRRVAGRVVTTCHSGPLVQRWAAELAEDQEKSRERRKRLKARTDALLADERLLDDLASEAKRLGEMVLVAAGFHRVNRGEWRKKRAKARIEMDETEADHSENPASPVAVPAVKERATEDQPIAKFIHEASQNDVTARTYFDKVCGSSSEGLSILVKLHEGDLVKSNENAMLVKVEPNDRLRREAIRRQLAGFRESLLGPGQGSPVERVLVERISACWLAVQDAESRLIRFMELDTEQPGSTNFEQKRFERAERRLVGLLKVLDQIRRKVPPSHRLNFLVQGDMQIGSQGTGPPAATSPTIELPDIAS